MLNRFIRLVFFVAQNKKPEQKYAVIIILRYVCSGYFRLLTQITSQGGISFLGMCRLQIRLPFIFLYDGKGCCTVSASDIYGSCTFF